MICSLLSKPDAPIAADGGIRRRNAPSTFERWLDLMALVEMLSPRWPDRRRGMVGSDWRL